MTPADLALDAALSFEAKKDSMRQTQSGTWKVTFTVQATDVPRSLTEAMPGARYQVVIVEIGDDELPRKPSMTATTGDARPQPKDKPAGAKPKRDWRDVPPAEQAGIRCEEAAFVHFLREQWPDDWHETQDTADCVRLICGVESRSLLSTNQRARIIWHQLDEQYQAWKAIEHA